MNNVIDNCVEFINGIYDDTSKEQFLNNLVRNKLEKIYEIDSKNLDDCLNAIYTVTDFSDISSIKYLLKKITKIINTDRNLILYIIEERL